MAKLNCSNCFAANWTEYERDFGKSVHYKPRQKVIHTEGLQRRVTSQDDLKRFESPKPRLNRAGEH